MNINIPAKLGEVKNGYEGGNLDDLEDQARSYLNIAEKYNSIQEENKWILMYRFYDEPHSANAKALFEYLKELYYKSEENKKVLRIFIKGEEWKGG